jgi:hypothetical protein
MMNNNILPRLFPYNGRAKMLKVLLVERIFKVGISFCPFNLHTGEKWYRNRQA